MGLMDFIRKLFGVPPPRTGGGYPPPLRSQAPAPRTNWPAPPQPSRPGYQPPQRQVQTLSLDADQFKPLPADQVRQQAMAMQFSGFFEFGRRSRIPSAVDPRTKLIDQ